ncbi:MAG TPA: ATP-binding protein [Burkholderiales bacterium]
MRYRNMLPLLALIAGWLVALAVVGALVVQGRTASLERGMRSTTGLAQVMEQHAMRTFQSATLVARGLSNGWWLARPSPYDAGFQSILRQRLDDLSQAQALFVVDEHGKLVQDTRTTRMTQLSFADREYFRAYRDDRALETGVFGPYRGRTPGVDWFMAVTARLGPPGQFHGVVGAAVNPQEFEKLYAETASLDGDVIALFHRDGTLIARHPAGGDEVGRRFGHLPPFRSGLQLAGSYRAPGATLAGDRVVSYRAVEGLPLLVYVSRSESAVLAQWRETAIGAAVAMGSLTLLLGWVLVREVRRARRRERQRAMRAQAEKMEALGQLTGGIAHDFSNLLGLFANSLHLLLREGASEAQRSQAGQIAHRSVARAREMVERLLAFARRRPLEVRAADLNALVRQAHALVAQAAGSRVEVTLELAKGLPPIVTDASQFEMAVVNLVVNARDALQGCGRVILRTTAGEEGRACLEVEDNGPGMPEEVLRRAMEPFFTTKGEAGTGLGLAQVYGFMHQHGGTMHIESAPGKGTLVHLCFPPERCARRESRPLWARKRQQGVHGQGAGDQAPGN